MNLPINISQLLHGKAIDSERLEFKEGWNPEVILRSICAFRNDFHSLGGGYIVVGIEEKDDQPVLSPKGVNPASIYAIQKELEELLSLKDRRVRMILKSMVDKELIVKLGNARNTYYEVKK
jgi:ATP-dependent DNA helicase RecG